jgi:hypothetical protein
MQEMSAGFASERTPFRIKEFALNGPSRQLEGFSAAVCEFRSKSPTDSEMMPPTYSD